MKFSYSYDLQTGREGGRSKDGLRNITNKQICSRSTSLTNTPTHQVHIKWSRACLNTSRGRGALMHYLSLLLGLGLSEWTDWIMTFKQNLGYLMFEHTLNEQFYIYIFQL